MDGEGSESGASVGGGGQPQYHGPGKSENGDRETIMWCATRYRQVSRRTSDTGGDWRRSLGHRNVRVQRCEGVCRRVQAPGKRWECKGAGARQGDTRKNKTRQRQAPSGPVCSEPCVWTHTLSRSCSSPVGARTRQSTPFKASER